MINGLHHIAIATQDMARLSTFYCDLFGFAVLYRGQWKQGNTAIDALVGLQNSAADYEVLGIGDFRIELFQYRSPVGQRPDPQRPVCDSGITHMCLQVKDIEIEFTRLQRAGMRFHAPPSVVAPGQRHRAVYGRDPDGNVIELIEILVADHPFGHQIPKSSVVDQAP